MRLWDLNSGEELRRCDAPNWILSVAFGPDNIQAVSGDLDRLVRLWDLDKGKEIRTFAGHKAAVNCVAFTPDGKRILSCGGGVLVTESVIILWDAITGEELCRFEGHTRPVTSLEIARDGRRFVSGSEDMTVRLWELPK